MKGFCTLNTDASVKGNTGGYAIWITTDERRIKKYDKFNTQVSDSNMAEIMAVINGMHLILNSGIDINTVCVNTDNAFCRNVLNKKDKFYTGNKELSELSKQLLNLCGQFTLVYAKNIKGHTKIDTSRHFVNRWCDEYARKGRLGIKEDIK